jgi:methylglutaconyl-CoA hydratase
VASQAVLSSVDARGVAQVTLNRPDRHNAFDADILARLAGLLTGLGRDNAVRVIVLTGSGPTFCAGADVEWMRRMAAADAAANIEDARALAEVLATLDALPKPTIARVQGPAFGGGVGLIACCDIAVAVADARLALTEVRVGLVPATISPYVIAAIGARLARRYMLTAEPVSGPAAVAAGLVHEVCERDRLDERVAALVDLLLRAGPGALRECKELIREVRASVHGEELRRATAERLARVRSSAEGREGLQAFLDKRRPAWWPHDS